MPRHFVWSRRYYGQRRRRTAPAATPPPPVRLALKDDLELQRLQRQLSEWALRREAWAMAHGYYPGTYEPYKPSPP